MSIVSKYYPHIATIYNKNRICVEFYQEAQIKVSPTPVNTPLHSKVRQGQFSLQLILTVI